MGFCSKELKKEFETAVINELSVFEPLKLYCSFEPKAIAVLLKNQPLPKYLREKKRVKVRSTPASTLQKKDPLK